MKISEFIQKIIDIEKERGEKATITMNYIDYLKEKKKIIEMEDKELD